MPNNLDSLYAEKAAQWAQYYTVMEQQLGTTATLVNFGDQRNAGRVNATTFTGMKFNTAGLSPVWTPATVLSSLATPLNLTNPDNFLGLAPIITLSSAGTETITTPDVTYFSRGNGTTDSAMSVGAWVNFTTLPTSFILGKNDVSTNEEWSFREGERTANRFGLEIKDESANVQAYADDVTDLVTGVWYFLVATYDGTGGATAATGIELYRNGAIIAAPTRVDNAGYVAMENLAAVTRLGGASTIRQFNGKMLGGPWGPFFTQTELTAEQVKNIYDRMRLGLGI